MALPQSATPTTDGQNRFPCKQCGAKLQFVPGTFVTVCPYCNTQNAISTPTDTKLVREIDYLATLRDLKEHAEKFVAMIVKCDACAATIQAPPNVTSLSCPFCGSNIVSTAKAATQIKPGALLPFKATRDEAVARFRFWIGKLWFAPNKLKHNGMLDSAFAGTYLPAWTYDSQTTTWYEGERGDAYWESQTVWVNGRPQTQQVRRIRWSPASGAVGVPFDDVLVVASKSLPIQEVEKLEPWDLPACVPYADDYLAGFRAECYQVGLEEGFAVAKQKMQPVIENAIREDIGGDEQQIHDTRSRYDAITFKHLLLPVWLSTYRYSGKVYRFMVNARTGEVVGERPYSAVKITLFVLMCVAIVGIIALIASHAR